MKSIINYSYILFFLSYAAAIHAQSVTWSVPDTNGIEGDTLLIPVMLDDDVTGMNILSFESELKIYGNYATILGIETIGTLAEDLGAVATNIYMNGGYYHAQLSVAGTTALIGNGVLFYLQVVAAHGYSVTFNGVNRMNEGSPAVTTNSGYVTITSLPTVTVYPNSGVLLMGDLLQFNGSGGSAPYTFTTSDTILATIDANGLLTAVNYGIVYVQATDTNGISDWTEDIEIRAFHLKVGDTLVNSLDTVVVPLYASDLNMLNVVSGEFELSHAISRLQYLDYVKSNNLLANFSISESYTESGGTGHLDMAFASPTPIAGGGPLLYVRYLSRLFSYNTNTTVSLSDVLFNQDLFAVIQSGNILINGIPELNISPGNNQSLFVDETLDFTAINGEPPYQYAVVPETKGSVDTSGLFMADLGGVCRVVVTDNLGQMTQSGLIEVFDGQLKVDHRCAQVGDTILLPVYISDLPDEQHVNSFEFTIDYRQPELEYLGYEKSNTLSSNWLVMSSILASGDVKIVAAGTQAQGGDQVMLYLKFLPSIDLTINEFAYVNLVEYELNEGSPHVQRLNGGISQSDDVIYEIIPSNQTPCNGTTNTYDQELTIYYTAASGSADIVVNDQVFSQTTSPQTILLSDLESEGQWQHISAHFSNSSSCNFNFYNVFQAPDSCFSLPLIVYVDSTAVGNNNGLNWQHAFNDLQDALDLARQGNVIEIWVSKGSYYPTSTGARSASFILVDSVPIYGGFSGMETHVSQRNPALYTTILSGDIGVKGDYMDNCYHVVKATNQTFEASLDGMTITEGNATGASSDDKHGGGLINFGMTTLNNVRFIDNRSELDGSTVHSTGSSAQLIIQNTQIDNTIVIPSVLFSIDDGSQFEMYGDSELKN